jgi:hypothetical protein
MSIAAARSRHPLNALQAELETWAAALKAYDEEDFEKSLDMFSVRVTLCHNLQRLTFSRA